MATKKSKNKNKSGPVNCPECKKQYKPKKGNFCPACGFELFSPVIEKKWSFKAFLAIAIVVAVFYLIYILFKEPIYYWLDKVPHR